MSRRTRYLAQATGRAAPLPSNFRVFALLVAVLVTGLGGAHQTSAAFTSGTSNPNNRLASGTVILTDDDSGSAVINASSLTAKSSVAQCLKVTHTGSVNSNVRLYGSSTGKLWPYVTMTITRGTSSSSFNSCSGFTPDGTTYVGGQAAGVVWTGLLKDFPSSYASGIVDAPGATEVWTNPETHAYRISMVVADNHAISSKTSSTTLTWEAQNV